MLENVLHIYLTNRVKWIIVVSVRSQIAIDEVKIHPVSVLVIVRHVLVPDERSNNLSALRPNPGTFQLNSPSPPALPSILVRKY